MPLQINSYTTFPRDYDPLLSDWYRFYRVISVLEDTIPNRIDTHTQLLDIGCHYGIFLRTMIHIYNCQATGCDQYPVEDKELKRYPVRDEDLGRYECFQKTENGMWKYHQIDVSNGIPLQQKYNVISALEVIEHIIDTDRFIENVRALLVDAGLFIITTPNINCLRNRVLVPLGYYPAELEYRNKVHHVRLYNVRNIIRQMQAHGFEVLAVEGVQMLPRSWITRNALARYVSEWLSKTFPSLSSNIILIARLRAK